jgi:hypothetical protein
MAIMAGRFQFRLRAIFFAMTIAAVLCLMLPPIFHSVQRHFAAKRRPTAPLTVQVVADPPEIQSKTASTQRPLDEALPRDATFFQATIIRVNGKRIDAGSTMNNETAERELIQPSTP